MLRALALWLAWGALLTGCGDSDEKPRCEIGFSQVCSWNAETQAYDRDCREVCSDDPCTPFRNGAAFERKCSWDEQTRSYTRGCTQGLCPPDDSPSSTPGPDGGLCREDAAALTTYYSNDPRCADAAGH